MASEKKKKPGKVRKGSKKRTFMMVMLLLVLTPVLRYGMLIFVLGMLPWLVATYVDDTQERNPSRVMLACNFSGVMPIMTALWKKGISFDNMWSVMMDPSSWLIMYGAAAFGWVLLWFFPVAVHFVLDLFQNSNVHGLKKRQQDIVDEWGMQVELASRRAGRNQAFADDQREKAAAINR